MTDQNKENESKELKPGFFVVADESIKQALFATDTLVAQGWTLMDVQTGAVSVEFQHLFDGVIVNDEHIPTIAERLEAFNSEEHEAIERLRAACPLGDSRNPYQIAQHFIDHTAWLDENLERAKKRNNLLCTEQDQLREALGIDVTVDLVDEVRRLKEAQREAVPAQVIGLEATIKERNEQWNKVCEALGLPDKGRTDEEKVAEEIEAMVTALDHHAGYHDTLSEDIKRIAEIADAVEDLCPEDTEPGDFADQWRWTEELIGILRNALGRHRDVMRQVAHIAGIQRVTYSSTDSEYEVCDYDDMLQRLRTLKENEHESTEHVSKELAQTLANGLVSKENRIKEMDEALETSLMEIAKQAQVIDTLRSQLKAAQRQCESQRVARRAAEGKIDGLERAIEIIGGRR